MSFVGTVSIKREEVDSPDWDPLIRSERMKSGFSTNPIPQTTQMVKNQASYRGPFQPNSFCYARLKPSQFWSVADGG